jgi:predicted permease
MSRRAPAWRRYLRFWGSDVEADVDDELRFHLEMRIQEYVARGASLDEARRRAEARFGDARRPRDECITIDSQAIQARRRGALLGDVVQDVRYASRLLRREWAAAALAILCLALGIGATTTMFSVANALLIRPLPFGNGNELYTIGERVEGAVDVNVASYPDYLDWRKSQHSFLELATMGQTSFAIPLATPVRASSALVSANFFRTLGVAPIRGRLFADGEDEVGAAPVAIVSRGFAERQLGGVAAAVGKSIDVRGISRTIVGVVPDEQVLPSNGELWLPVPRDLNIHRSDRNLDVFGWIKPGVTIDQARAELAGLESELARRYPKEDGGLAVTITPLRERVVGNARPTLAVMFAAALLVLLVACANVAGIQLARATARVREIAVRSAIGASRTRVLRQLLTESVLLSFVGGLLGTALAYRASAIAAKSVLGLTPSWLQPSVDPRVLAFALAVSVLTGVLFGVAPAMRLTRVHASDALRAGRSAVGPSRARLQQACVVVQLALSIVLLVAAGLSIRSIHRLQQIPVGFDTRGVLLFSVTMQGPPYDDEPERRARIASQIAERAASLSGVAAAGATSNTPLRCCSQWKLHIDGRPDTPGGNLMVTGNSVTPGYFRAMGIPLLRGRYFTIGDDQGTAPVILISETFAARFWPRGDAIGHTIQDGSDHATVVGIVSDVKQGGLLDAPEPQFYRPYTQKRVTSLTFAVRAAAGDPTRLTSALRAIVHDVDPRLPMYNVSTMAKRLDDAMLSRRTFERLMITFGGVALLLAAIGLFAVTSFVVEQRTRELGLRIALGADPAELMAFVLRGTAILAVLGSVIGLAAALGAVRWLSHTLYGVRGAEPAVFAAAAGLLAAVTVIAGYGPARRASAADPMEALRAD